MRAEHGKRLIPSITTPPSPPSLLPLAPRAACKKAVRLFALAACTSERAHGRGYGPGSAADRCIRNSTQRRRRVRNAHTRTRKGTHVDKETNFLKKRASRSSCSLAVLTSFPEKSGDFFFFFFTVAICLRREHCGDCWTLKRQNDGWLKTAATCGDAPRLTEAEDGVVLHQRPRSIVHAVAFVDQQLAHVPGRHVGGDLHHFAGPILAPHLHDLEKQMADRRDFSLKNSK